MLRKILSWGVIGGVIAGGLLSISVLALRQHGMASGYLIMLLGLSTIFVAIKRQRDIEQGGVIRFWPAFGLGIGISVIAGIVYVAIWETSVALAGVDFAGDYARAVIAQQKANGASGAELAKVSVEMAAFQAQYANPLFRWPMTFVEIFPVGVLVSVVSAGLLCNSRFLPARHRA